MTWDELCEVFNAELGNDYTSSAYRKKIQQAHRFRDEVFICDDYRSTIESQKRELERLKIQYRDERNAWNKQNYIDARIEQKLDYLEQSMKDIGKIDFNCSPVCLNSLDSKKELVVCLSDLHIGQTFKNEFGYYDSDVAQRRLGEYLNKAIEVGSLHGVSAITVVVLGDSISGNIHQSLQVTNREDVINQIKLSTSFIASFVVALASYFDSVSVCGVSGNHSRLVTEKEKALKDERLDSLILWGVKNLTSHIDRVRVDDGGDSTVIKFNVCGKTFFGVHGDYDEMSLNSASKLITMMGEFPYGIIMGHKHSPEYKDVNGVKCYRSGSLAGTGDDYTIEKRLRGSANQTILVCSEDGVECVYNVELK